MTIEVIQAAYYMVAATGVLVAAIFYLLNMRETMKNRRATFANNVMQFFFTEEFQLRFIELLSMQWSDYEDFKRKYDSAVNHQNYAKRVSVWGAFDSLGGQYRSGNVSLGDFSRTIAFGIVITWFKFKPVIRALEGVMTPKDTYRDYEYLACALEERLKDIDANLVKEMNSFHSPL